MSSGSLLVIAIIGILIALLLPAVQRAFTLIELLVVIAIKPGRPSV